MNLYVYDYVRLAPDKQISLHSQTTWELSCVVTGCGQRTIGDVCEPFAAGDCLLVPPHIPHCWQFDKTCTDKNGRIENITIKIKPEFFERLAAAFPDTAVMIAEFTAYDAAVSFTGERSREIIGIMARMRGETETERAASLVSLIGIIAERGGRAVGRRSNRDIVKQRLSEIRIYVACNHTRNISVAEAGGHIGMNRTAFCTFFRKQTGRTFVEYLTEYRIGKAERLLREEGLSVSEICYACGFNSISYFSRTFRRLRGITPSAVRKSS